MSDVNERIQKHRHINLQWENLLYLAEQAKL